VKPVVKLQAGETIQAMRAAASSSSPHRRIGILSVMYLTVASGSASTMGVRMTAGASALTVIPVSAFLAQRFHHADQSRLAGRIGGHAGIAVLAGDGRHVKDPAIARGQHPAQHGLGEDQRAAQIDLADPVEIGQVHFMALDVGLAGDAGAIHQAMDLPQPPGCLGHRSFHARGVGYFDGNGKALIVGAGYSVGRGLRAFAVPVQACDVDTLPGKELGSRLADAAGGADDDDVVRMPVDVTHAAAPCPSVHVEPIKQSNRTTHNHACAATLVHLSRERQPRIAQPGAG